MLSEAVIFTVKASLALKFTNEDVMTKKIRRLVFNSCPEILLEMSIKEMGIRLADRKTYYSHHDFIGLASSKEFGESLDGENFCYYEDYLIAHGISTYFTLDWDRGENYYPVPANEQQSMMLEKIFSLQRLAKEIESTALLGAAKRDLKVIREAITAAKQAMEA